MAEDGIIQKVLGVLILVIIGWAFLQVFPQLPDFPEIFTILFVLVIIIAIISLLLGRDRF